VGQRTSTGTNIGNEIVQKLMTFKAFQKYYLLSPNRHKLPIAIIIYT